MTDTPIMGFPLGHDCASLRNWALIFALLIGIACSGTAFGFDCRDLKGVDAPLKAEARALSLTYGMNWLESPWLKNARWEGAYRAESKDPLKLDLPLDDSSALIQFLFPAPDRANFVPNQYPGAIKSLKPKTVGRLLQAIFQLKPEQLEKLKNHEPERKALHQSWIKLIFESEDPKGYGKYRRAPSPSHPTDCAEGVKGVDATCETETQRPLGNLEVLEKFRKKLLLPDKRRPHEKDFVEALIGALIETKVKGERYHLPHLAEHSLLAFFAAKAQGKEDLLELWRGMPDLLDRTQGEPHWILDSETSDPTAVEKREKFLKEEFNAEDFLSWEKRFQQTVISAPTPLESTDGKELKTDSHSDSDRVFSSQSPAEMTVEFFSNPEKAVYLACMEKQKERPRSIAYSTAHYKKMPYSDCGETSLRNFLNYALFNPHSSSRIFDSKLLPAGVKPDSSLFQFYEKHPNPKARSLTSVHDDWSGVVSNLKGVKVEYFKKYKNEESNSEEHFEINAGVSNMLAVFENLLADSELSKRKDKEGKWDRVCRLMSRDGFQLDWSVKGGSKDQVEKRDTGIDLEFTVNNKSAFSWQFQSGHFALVDAPSRDAESWVKKIQSQLKTQEVQSLPLPLLAWLGEDLDPIPLVAKLPKKDRTEAKEHLLLGRPLVSENDYFSFVRSILQDQMQSYYPHALRVLQQIPADLNGQCQIQELLLHFPTSTELPLPFQELRKISDERIRSEPKEAAKTAAENGWARLMERLFELGVDPKTDTNRLLHRAAEYGRTEMAKLLLKHGAKIDKKDSEGKTPLHGAAERGQTETAKLLLERGTKVEERDQSGSTPLHGATANGHTETVKLLLERGAKIDERNNYGRTSLYEAAEYGHTETTKILLERGAKVDEKDLYDKTPLHRAAGWGRTEIVKLLLEGRAKIDEKDQDGKTPLYWAAVWGRIETVKFLLERGAKVDEKDRLGSTPLHGAAEQGQTEMAKLLLERGAKIDERNTYGHTPLYGAEEYGHTETVNLLKFWPVVEN